MREENELIDVELQWQLRAKMKKSTADGGELKVRHHNVYT
jgi:hypothetical protein